MYTCKKHSYITVTKVCMQDIEKEVANWFVQFFNKEAIIQPK